MKVHYHYISDYLCFRPDLWPSVNYEDKLEKFQEKFVIEIKLKNSLGNMMKKLDDQLKTKDKQKEVNKTFRNKNPAKSGSSKKKSKLDKRFMM